MKGQARSRFDLDVLRDLAGAKTIARGEAYYSDDRVAILSIDQKRVLAQVAGTEDYRTVLSGRGKSIDGECSCPGFEEWGFCKHMVATALAANALEAAGEAKSADAMARIRAHLKEKSPEALVDMIVDLAERDATLFNKLSMAAAVLHDDDKTVEARLRKDIDRVTRTGGFVDYRQAPEWAAHVDEILNTLATLLSNGRARLALALAERAVDRIEGAIGSIDDSDGHSGDLLHRAGEIHLAAACAAKPEPVELARNLFAREMESDYGTFSGASVSYAEVLGDQGLDEYRRLAAAAWKKLPARSGAVKIHDEFSGDYCTLKDILDIFAERDGDAGARIALRAKDLTSPWSYLELAEFCHSQGLAGEALRWAEEGLWIFEDARPDERLLIFAAKLLSKAGRTEDAEAHLWRAFEKAPSLDLYTQLCRLGGEPARERAVTFLESRTGGKEQARRHHPDLLIEIFMREKLFDAAWAAVSKHGASASIKQTLAAKSEKTHPGEALEVYSLNVEQLANTGAYEEAARLIARMARLRSAPAQSAYIADLKTRFSRKRTFMKLLLGARP